MSDLFGRSGLTGRAAMSLHGLDQVRGAFGRLEKGGVKSAVRAGLLAAMQPVTKALRSEVNGASISAELKAAIRRTIGARITKGDEVVLKAGFGVGKAGGAKGRAAKARADDDAKRGVGISGNNVHWFILGTAQRELSQRRLVPLPNAKTMRGLKGNRRKQAQAAVAAAGSRPAWVQFTGQVQPVLQGALAAAVQNSGEAITRRMAERISQVLAREAAKKGG